eukprot:3940811-Rhodomonas_salina.1
MPVLSSTTIIVSDSAPPLPAAPASPDEAADQLSSFALPPNTCFRRPTSTPALLLWGFWNIGDTSS